MTPGNTLSLRATLMSLDENFKRTRNTPDLTQVVPAISPMGYAPCPPAPAKPKTTVPKTKKSRSKSRVMTKSKTPTALSSSGPHISVSFTDLKGAKTPEANDSKGNVSSGSKLSGSSSSVRLPQLKDSDKDTNQSAIKELIASAVSDNPETTKKKVKRPALLNAIRPENAMEEKDKFMKSNFQYNPQLTYKNPPREAALAKFSKPSSRLLHVAEKVLHRVMSMYGSYERFVERTAGRTLSRYECLEAARAYLTQEGMLGEVSIKVTDEILSRASMTRIRGQPTLQLRSGCIRAHWMDGVMRHEVGTHYTRSSNNRRQAWSKAKKRRALELGPVNPTEEGLAALHSIIYREQPSLFRSALLYYTTYQASRLSFTQLFQDISKFVKDPEMRWDYCMRAKRGQEDTEKPGGFAKDQVYFRGAIEILKHRHTIDFHALLKCGKVDYRDVEKLKEIADLENTRVPSFMADLDLYKTKLGEILDWNGLTDQDLMMV